MTRQPLRSLLNDPLYRFQFSLLMLLMLIAFGTIGYMMIEDLSVIDALYMTIITITTVGFGEIGSPSSEGRIFTILLIILGVGVGAWAIRNGVEVVLGDTLWHSVQRKKMDRTIQDLKGHYIICGFGRIGRQIARDMEIRNQPYLVIDRSPERTERLRERDKLFILGDATEDNILLAAGIERAAGMVAALNSDADNVLAVLTARGINPSLQIVARSSDDKAENKLVRAGADRVVSPYTIGGNRLALSMLQPTVHDFFAHVFNVEQPDVDMGEVEVREGSALVGKTLAECNLRQQWGLIVIGVKLADGNFTISPDPHRKLEPGEVLIVIGSPTQILDFARSRS